MGSHLTTLFSPADRNPEVLVLNSIEMGNGGGVYADEGKHVNEVILFSVDPKYYTGKKVLAVPNTIKTAARVF